MAYGTRVSYEALRSLAFGSISGTYAALGTPTTGHCRLYAIKNNTNADLILSLDGSTDHVFLSSNSYMITDLSSNKVRDDGLFISVGTQFYIKDNGSAASSGSVYLEVLVAEGGV